MVQCFSLTTKQHQQAYQPQKPSLIEIDEYLLHIRALFVLAANFSCEGPSAPLFLNIPREIYDDLVKSPLEAPFI